MGGFSHRRQPPGPIYPGSKEGIGMACVEKTGEVWRCEVCGNVVEVKEAGGGELICCGGPMTKVK